MLMGVFVGVLVEMLVEMFVGVGCGRSENLGGTKSWRDIRSHSSLASTHKLAKQTNALRPEGFLTQRVFFDTLDIFPLKAPFLPSRQ